MKLKINSNCNLFTGSEVLKQKFCKEKEVQRKFMDIASSSENLLKSKGIHILSSCYLYMFL